MQRLNLVPIKDRLLLYEKGQSSLAEVKSGTVKRWWSPRYPHPGWYTAGLLTLYISFRWERFTLSIYVSPRCEIEHQDQDCICIWMHDIITFIVCSWSKTDFTWVSWNYSCPNYDHFQYCDDHKHCSVFRIVLTGTTGLDKCKATLDCGEKICLLTVWKPFSCILMVQTWYCYYQNCNW